MIDPVRAYRRIGADLPWSHPRPAAGAAPRGAALEVGDLDDERFSALAADHGVGLGVA